MVVVVVAREKILGANYSASNLRIIRISCFFLNFLSISFLNGMHQ